MGEIRYCRKCGARLQKGLRFCGNCGASVSGMQEGSSDIIENIENIDLGTDPGWEDVSERTVTPESGEEEATVASGVQYVQDAGQGDRDPLRFGEEETWQFEENSRGGAHPGGSIYRGEENLDPDDMDLRYHAPAGGSPGGRNDRDRLLLIVVGILLAAMVGILLWLIYSRRNPKPVETEDVAVIAEDSGMDAEETDSEFTSGEEGGEQETVVEEESSDTQDNSDSAYAQSTGDTGTENPSDTEETTPEQESTEQAGRETEEETEQETGSGGYILPDSAGRVYTRSEIEALSDTELLYALNEIYARHGRIFKDDQIREYFESQSWYEGTVSGDTFDPVQDQIFNAYEKENRDLIVEVMEGRGLR